MGGDLIDPVRAAEIADRLHLWRIETALRTVDLPLLGAVAVVVFALLAVDRVRRPVLALLFSTVSLTASLAVVLVQLAFHLVFYRAPRLLADLCALPAFVLVPPTAELVLARDCLAGHERVRELLAPPRPEWVRLVLITRPQRSGRLPIPLLRLQIFDSSTVLPSFWMVVLALWLLALAVEWHKGTVAALADWYEPRLLALAADRSLAEVAGLAERFLGAAGLAWATLLSVPALIGFGSLWAATSRRARLRSLARAEVSTRFDRTVSPAAVAELHAFFREEQYLALAAGLAGNELGRFVAGYLGRGRDRAGRLAGGRVALDRAALTRLDPAELDRALAFEGARRSFVRGFLDARDGEQERALLEAARRRPALRQVVPLLEGATAPAARGEGGALDAAKRWAEIEPLAARGRDDERSFFEGLHDEALVATERRNEGLEVADEAEVRVRIGRRLAAARETAITAPFLRQQRAFLEEGLESRKLIVAVEGAFSSGKSTLINALLGIECLPTGVEPVSAVLTHIVHGPELRFEVEHEDGRVEELADAETFRAYVDQRARASERGPVSSRITCDCELLRHVDLVDTPGLGSINERHDRHTERFMEVAHVVLWVMRARTGGSDLDRRVTGKLASLTGKTFFVMNKVDTLAGRRERDLDAFADSLDRCVGYVTAACPEVEREAIFPVSALWHREGRHPDKAGIDRLEARLEQEFRENNETLRRTAQAKKLRALRGIGRGLEEALTRVAAPLVGRTEELDAALAAPVHPEEAQTFRKVAQQGLERERATLRAFLGGGELPGDGERVVGRWLDRRRYRAFVEKDLADAARWLAKVDVALVALLAEAKRTRLVYSEEYAAALSELVELARATELRLAALAEAAAGGAGTSVDEVDRAIRAQAEQARAALRGLAELPEEIGRAVGRD